jgi:hypothetical protein
VPWTTKLARPIILADGTELVTFKDTIEVLIKFFAGSALSDALDHAIGLLVKADTTRKPTDIEVATSEMASVLRNYRLLNTGYAADCSLLARPSTDMDLAAPSSKR